jgi:hypothetical protein
VCDSPNNPEEKPVTNGWKFVFVTAAIVCWLIAAAAAYLPGGGGKVGWVAAGLALAYAPVAWDLAETL